MKRPGYRVCILVSALVLAAAPALADEPPDHAGKAAALLQGEQYAEALKELEAAYAERQAPRLLHDIGLCHQRLGHVREALDAYRRYLATGAAGPADQAEVEGEVARLAALAGERPAPVAAIPIETERPRLGLSSRADELRRTGRGLIIGGSCMFGAAYMAAVLTSAFTINAHDYGSSSSSGNLGAAGGVLLIPIVGPFISAGLYREPYWSIPWAFVDGVAQAGGLAMIIVGAQKQKKGVLENLAITPYSSGKGGGLMVAGRF